MTARDEEEAEGQDQSQVLVAASEFVHACKDIAIAVARAKDAIEQASTVEQAKDVRDRWEAVRRYAQLVKDKKLEIDAAEVGIRAERKIGVLILATKLNPGLDRGRLRRGSELEPRDTRPSLSDLGVNKKLSAWAQRLARFPADEFEQRLAAFRDQAQRDSRRSGRAFARTFSAVKPSARFDGPEPVGRQEADLVQWAAQGFRAGVILADPPWRFEARGLGGDDRSAERHYRTCSLDEIKRLPVGLVAAEDCVLFLWIVNCMLPEALEVIAAWGFDYRTIV